MMDYSYQRVKINLETLKANSVTKSVELTGFSYMESGYKKGDVTPAPGDGKWSDFGKTQLWGGTKDSHAWFYKHIKVPEEFSGLDVSLSVRTGREGLWDASNPQFLVYLNGEIYQGLDTNHHDVLLQAGKEYDVCLYAYAGMIAEDVRFIAELRGVDRLCEKLYYDLYAPYEFLGLLDEDDYDYRRILEVVNSALNLLDYRVTGSDAYRESIQAAIDYLQKELYGAFSNRDVSVICVGHSHIDVAWLWTLEQTREKVLRTFSTVLRLMDRYPEYKFTASQAQLFQYLKEESPALFEQVRKRVAEGRFEIEGAMWVEADCNLSSGESLVRQILHGKRFFKEEFNVDSKILWLPDVFGYSAAMPQILKKSGVDWFVTSKISWNEENKMPYDTFIWKGIDGTEMPSYFLTAQNKVKGRKPANFTTYNATTEPKQIMGAWERYQQKTLTNEVLLTFGFGDGGGGPTAHNLEVLQRLGGGFPQCPAASVDTVAGFLSRLDEKIQKSTPRTLPVWSGELYLEFHRGTYTSNAKNKKNNRVSEFLCQKAETLGVTDSLLTGSEYPKAALQKAWESILLHQFHDIIPGSSIKEVYDESDIAYAALQKDVNGLCASSYESIARRVSTPGGLLVFNPNSYTGEGVVESEGKSVYVRDIPAKGYKVVNPAPADRTSRVKLEKTSGGHLAENDFFILNIDGNGNICRLYDKRYDREVLREGAVGNALLAFEDIPRGHDAWEISNYYVEKMWPVNDLVSVNLIDDGARAGIAVEKKFLSSTICQTIYLYNDIARIDFDTDIDWKEEHILLKASFPTNIKAQKATYEIQFGNLERPTHTNTSWDAAQFEVCAQKFADLSEYGYGVSLLNDCKYGYDIHDGDIRLTLLKCATYPNVDADRCRHEFVYSLFPHAGDFRQAGTIEQSYALNVPLTAIAVGKQEGSLPDCFSLLECDNPAVVIETIKQAENGGDIIVRLYESFGGHGRANVKLGFNIGRAELSDLMENAQSALPVKDNTVALEFSPFEIKTLKIAPAK
ncbi:alpha-mannosidase [Clostridia bacterium]|nr:alpha-mannosidase [Clostridia bacterium]